MSKKSTFYILVLLFFLSPILAYFVHGILWSFFSLPNYTYELLTISMMISFKLLIDENIRERK